MPSAPDGENESKSGSANQPLSSSGTPRRRLPSAAPKSTGASVEASQKVPSQKPRHMPSPTCERNSIAMPRRISTQSTSMIAR